MKFTITLKDPDGVGDCIRDAARASVAEVLGLSDEERKDLLESRMESIGDSIKKWVEYDEYVVVEFDTDAGTATVLPVAK